MFQKPHKVMQSSPYNKKPKQEAPPLKLEKEQNIIEIGVTDLTVKERSL